MLSSQVVLVNAHDEPSSVMEKMEAHQQGVLHRAFSIFIFNESGNMLLQQRAEKKYHSAGLWTNACCSHPFPGEETEHAAHRRLKEELGFDTILYKAFDFTYKAQLDNGLTEHEYDHVYLGKYDGLIVPDLEEVQHHCYTPMEIIRNNLRSHSKQYTAWFKIAFPKLEQYLAVNNS